MAKIEEATSYEVYEIFARTSPDGSYVHEFSLLAGSPEMALTLARENFLRRRPCYGVWAVRREDIAKPDADDRDLYFRQPKSYREVSDYRYLVDKWRRYRQQAMTRDTMA